MPVTYLFYIAIHHRIHGMDKPRHSRKITIAYKWAEFSASTQGTTQKHTERALMLVSRHNTIEHRHVRSKIVPTRYRAMALANLHCSLSHRSDLSQPYHRDIIGERSNLETTIRGIPSTSSCRLSFGPGITTNASHRTRIFEIIGKRTYSAYRSYSAYR